MSVFCKSLNFVPRAHERVLYQQEAEIKMPGVVLMLLLSKNL